MGAGKLAPEPCRVTGPLAAAGAGGGARGVLSAALGLESLAQAMNARLAKNGNSWATTLDSIMYEGLPGNWGPVSNGECVRDLKSKIMRWTYCRSVVAQRSQKLLNRARPGT